MFEGTFSSYRKCSIQKSFLKHFANFTGKHLYQKVSFLIKLQVSACNFIKKETGAGVFPVDFAKIFRTTFLQNTLLAASVT